ncbi:MAG TPA: enoyl-CoA hydratase/isomerase family protein [Candidatus Acidoferrales bacterium]|nr:enoyl-CoA hydratase/isomerase family protein [Bryobacteraceae bacterium]HTS67124.1 enoyl-CoA hydratase/isomerase family protein [Candidatus Acidoferrales bacterium]
MGTEHEVLLTRIERNGAVWAEIELNRPDKGNALNMPMIGRLAGIVGEIERDCTLRAVVIRARGRFFSTGGDIEAWRVLSPREIARNWILPGIQVFDRISSLPQPVIAVLSGHALGGGLELALAADLRIAVQSAKLGTPEVTLGMISGWMGVRRLAETIGVARARHMTLLGSPISAAQAFEWGLITAVAEDNADLEGQLDEWLARLCANGPAAMALAKNILATMHRDLRHQHADAAAEASGTQDCKEGVRAFFEKRKPAYRNR